MKTIFKKRQNWMIQFTFATILLPMSFGCSGALQLNSQWRPAEIKVDGDRSDWQDALTYVEKKEVSIGAVNDGEFLYLCLAASDPGLQRQMQAMGFTIWFDPDGGSEHKLGLRFPIGLREIALMRGDMGRGRERGGQMDAERMKSEVAEMHKYIEIIGADGGTQRLELSTLQAQGIEAKISGPADILTYEIKVPLRESGSHPFAIGVENSDLPLGIGFETNTFDSGDRRQGMGSGRPGGGFGGRSGGSGGRGGRGGRGGSRPQVPDPFKLWTSVTLGSEESAATAQIIDTEK